MCMIVVFVIISINTKLMKTTYSTPICICLRCLEVPFIFKEATCIPASIWFLAPAKLKYANALS